MCADRLATTIRIKHQEGRHLPVEARGGTSGRTRHCGKQPAAKLRSRPARAAASISCSTSSRRLSRSASAFAIYRRELEAAGYAFELMRITVARNIFVARDATEKHEAVRRQVQIHETLLSLSRGSESRPGSHILGYASTPEAHSLIGTAGEVAAGLAALEEVGVAYVLLFGQGSRDNLRRFAERVMPKFGAPRVP